MVAPKPYLMSDGPTLKKAAEIEKRERNVGSHIFQVPSEEGPTKKGKRGDHTSAKVGLFSRKNCIKREIQMTVRGLKCETDL